MKTKVKKVVFSRLINISPDGLGTTYIEEDGNISLRIEDGFVVVTLNGRDILVPLCNVLQIWKNI
jgi:hypothetical protein